MTRDLAQRTSGMNAMPCPANVDACTAASNVATANRIARIEVFDDLQIAEPIWRALEADGVLATPYQRYHWILSWQIHIGKLNGVTPLLVVGRQPDGKPGFLWPLGTRRLGPLTIGEFLGGKHTNYNLALWRRDLAATISAAEIDRILSLMEASRASISCC